MGEPQSKTSPERPPEAGTTPGAAPKENPDKNKEKEKSAKDISKLLGEGIAGDLTKGMQAYGQFIEALEKLGAVDILDLIRKGFNVWQIEAELKKNLEGKLISSSDIGLLKTNEDAMKTAESGEKDGDYILRCLGLKQKYTKLTSEIPKRNDGKDYDPTLVSMIWLKTSGAMNLLAYNAVKDGLKANPETKKPILYENDLVYITTGEKTYATGFIKDFDLENDKIKISTVENGAVVIKEFELKKVLIAFHLNGNTTIMKKSIEHLEQDKKEDKPADAPSTTPAATPPAAAS